MDTCEYSTLSAVLADIADPRKKRGQRHAWTMILVLIDCDGWRGSQRESDRPMGHSSTGKTEGALKINEGRTQCIDLAASVTSDQC